MTDNRISQRPPARNEDAIRRNLEQMGIDTNDIAGRWLLRIMTRGEWAYEAIPSAGDAPAKK